MRIEERYEKAIGQMKELSEIGVPIVVEGKRDEARLREIGITGPIIKVQGKRSVLLAEEIAKDYGEAIIMTDFDRRGASRAKWIDYHLRRCGVKVNTNLRKVIFGSSFARKTEELPV